MSDVIERKKLIEEIQLIAKELNKDKQNAEPDDSDLILAVDNQLSAIWRIKGVINNQPQVPQWIPCSERLPEETGYYLCSVEWYGTSTKELLISNGHEIQDRIMLIHYLESNKSFKEIENFSTYKVIAWQPLPLPQPYTENRKES